MTKLILSKNDQGAILHFSDGTRALVNIADQSISSTWEIGTELMMIRRPNSFKGSFNLHLTEKVFVDCNWRNERDEIIV